MGIQVSAILLAAGSSKRIGQLKQLLPLNNKPLIRHCLESAIASGIERIIVVISPQGIEIARIIEDLKGELIPPHPPLAKGGWGDFKINVVFNNNNESEMAESVRIGINAVDDSSKGILVFPSDHPLVSADTIKIIIDTYNKNPENIIIPAHNGKRGHPAMFPRTIIEDLFSGINLREIMSRYPEKVMIIDVQDEGVIFDIDTLGDFEKIQKVYQRRPRCPSSS